MDSFSSEGVNTKDTRYFEGGQDPLRLCFLTTLGWAMRGQLGNSIFHGHRGGMPHPEDPASPPSLLKKALEGVD
jgi:hypothetical protein